MVTPSLLMRERLETMIDKKRLTKILAASLLGDGSIEKGKYGNARFSIVQKSIHRDHVDFIANELRTITGVSYTEAPAAQYEIKGKLCNVSAQTRIRTQLLPFFTVMHERYYLNKVKRVDEHYLTLIDAEFMAIWYMQDGYLHRSKDAKNPTPDPVLCTDSFTYGDQLLLRHAIIEKTGFIFNIQRRGLNKNGEQAYRMHLSRKQTDDFITFVRPFMQESFLYKITR